MFLFIVGYMLRKFGKGKIVIIVDVGFVLDDYFRFFGGEVIRMCVGDVVVVDEFVKYGGVFGGELSGMWIIL